MSRYTTEIGYTLDAAYEEADLYGFSDGERYGTQDELDRLALGYDDSGMSPLDFGE